jgi:DNA helicase HerA-like ATPase
MNVLGRAEPVDAGPVATLGTYRAADGSEGARVGLDLDHPHAALVVGKRGYGKSHTLGVLAEGATRAAGVAPVVVDPMGEFGGLAAGALPARVVDAPTVCAGGVPPAVWPTLFDVSTTDPVGALLWEAAREAETLDSMAAHVDGAAVDGGVRRAARNHLQLADSWDVFDPEGLDAASLLSGSATVLDCSALDDRAASALVRSVVSGLYDACVRGRPDRLPWLLVDEAHGFFDGVAAPALDAVLTRGRTPGVSLVAATQRPGALPGAAISQSDLLLAHRLTAEADVDALSSATPTYLTGTLRDRLPTDPGGAVVVDDVTESVHGVQVRERETPHGGADPRASARGCDGETEDGCPEDHVVGHGPPARRP